MCMCVCVQGSTTRKTLVCASSEDSRKSVRSLRVSASVLVDVVYIPQTENCGSTNGGTFGEISSFIA